MKFSYTKTGETQPRRPAESLRWDTDSERTQNICRELHIDAGIRFVETAEQDGIIYVSCTCGKPDEWALVRSRALNAGYLFVDINGLIVAW